MLKKVESTKLKKSHRNRSTSTNLILQKVTNRKPGKNRAEKRPNKKRRLFHAAGKYVRIIYRCFTDRFSTEK